MRARDVLAVAALAAVLTSVAAGSAAAAPSPQVKSLQAQVTTLKTKVAKLEKTVKTMRASVASASKAAATASTAADEATVAAATAKSAAELATAKTNCLTSVVPATVWGNYVFTDDVSFFKGSGIDIAPPPLTPRLYIANVEASCVGTTFQSVFGPGAAGSFGASMFAPR